MRILVATRDAVLALDPEEGESDWARVTGGWPMEPGGELRSHPPWLRGLAAVPAEPSL